MFELAAGTAAAWLLGTSMVAAGVMGAFLARRLAREAEDALETSWQKFRWWLGL